MKTIKYAILICVVSSLLSCSDFLKESSQDTVRPTTLNDLKELMLMEAYPRQDNFINTIDFLTDDVDSNYPTLENQLAVLNDMAPIYCWDDNINERDDMNYWKKYYKRIMGCNLVLDMVDQMKGTTQDRENMRGQALALRSYYYFMLVNLYGYPYNAAGDGLNTLLGVPLILTSAVSETYPKRNTLLEVYTQIEADLLKSLPLLETYGTENGTYRVTALFAHTVLSRLYLYQERWEESIKHADYVIENKRALTNLAFAVSMDSWGITISFDYSKNVYSASCVETIWNYSNQNEMNVIFDIVGMSYPPAYKASADLFSLYDFNENGQNVKMQGDLRVRFFYTCCGIPTADISKPIIVPHFGQRGDRGMSYNPSKGMRVSELYLNRAEANIRLAIEGKGNANAVDEAVKDLNYIRERRFDTRNVSYVEVGKSDDINEVLKFCLEERRRELSFEEHRWFDLRRYGMPEIKHKITLSVGNTQEYILPAKSSKYTLLIPQEAIQKNYNLEQNPR